VLPHEGNRLNTVKYLFTAFIAFLTLSFSDALSTGLYLNLPQHTARVDSARALLTFHESVLARPEGEASFLYSEVSFNAKRYLSVRLGLSYIVFEEEGRIVDGVGDGFLYSTLRVQGDTLGTEGVFIRADMRIPIGSKGLYPFSYASLDGGLGVEARYNFPLFFVRASGTFYMCGERIRNEELELDNYLISSLSLKFSLPASADLVFTVFSVRFRGGDAREIYQIMLVGNLSKSFSMIAGAALDAAGGSQRVFDSQMFLSIDYRFPPMEKKVDEGEGLGPDEELPVQFKPSGTGLD